MTRILFSIAALGLVACGAFLIAGPRWCVAVPTHETMSLPEPQPATASEVPREAVSLDIVDSKVDQPAGDLLAQEPTLEPFAESTPSPKYKPASTKRTIKVPVISYEQRVVEMEVPPLQQRYSSLMLQQARRMTEEELKTAIEEVEAELKALDAEADAALQEVIEILEQLQEEAPGTPAAHRAAAALPILQGAAPPPTPTGQTLQPPTYSDPTSFEPGDAIQFE